MSEAVEKQDWVARLQTGGEVQSQALAELRTILVRGLKKGLISRNVTEAFCEDVAQDTLLKILGKLDQFGGRSKFTTWAMAIAVRTAISELRRKRFQDVSLDDISRTQGTLQIDLAVDEAAPPENALERQSILEKLQELIENSLTDRQRLAIQGALNGMAIEVIAEKLESNRNAIYKLIHDARRKLREGMESANYDWSDIQSVIG